MPVGANHTLYLTRLFKVSVIYVAMYNIKIIYYNLPNVYL